MRLQDQLGAFGAHFARSASAARSADRAKMGAHRASFAQERAIQRDDSAPDGMPPDQRGNPAFGCKSPGSGAGSRRVLSWLLSPAVLHAASPVSDDFARDHSTRRSAGRHLAATTGRLALHSRRNQTHLRPTGRRRQPACATLLAWSDVYPRSCAPLCGQTTRCCQTLMGMMVGNFRCRPPMSPCVAAPLAWPSPTSIAAPARTRGDPDSAESIQTD